MKSALRLALAAWGTVLMAASMQAEAVLTCTAPGFAFSGNNTTCTLPANALPSPAPGTTTIPTPQPLQLWANETLGVSGNSISGIADVAVLNGPQFTTGPFPQTIIASWSDAVTVFNNPSDIWKVSTLVYGGFLSGQSVFSLGSYTAPMNACDVGASCSPTGDTVTLLEGKQKVSFEGFWALTYTQPEDPYTFNLQFGRNETDFAVQVTVDRYLADGVTPDPFSVVPTPEPAPLGLMLSAVVAGCCWRRLKH